MGMAHDSPTKSPVPLRPSAQGDHYRLGMAARQALILLLTSLEDYLGLPHSVLSRTERRADRQRLRHDSSSPLLDSDPESRRDPA